MNISNSARKILNDERLIEHRDMWIRRLTNLFNCTSDESSHEHVFSIDGVLGVPKEPMRIYENPELWVVESLENLATTAELTYNDYIFRPPCIESDVYGVHFIDSIFGSDVFFQDNQWYNRNLTNEVGDLEKPDLEKCEAWQVARRAALEFVRQDVKLPMYGMPTISSALNIAVNLYGEEILVAMLIEPERAFHDLQIINDVLCEIHNWYLKALPEQQLQPVISWERTQPPGYGQICGCTTQLVSGEIYKDLIAPLDAQLLSQYPGGGMIHLCGAHEHILPMLRDMKQLKAVQINDRATVDLDKYYSLLRKDQIIYLIPCEQMSVEQAMEITGGNRLVVLGSQSSVIGKCCSSCGH